MRPHPNFDPNAPVPCATCTEGWVFTATDIDEDEADDCPVCDGTGRRSCDVCERTHAVAFCNGIPMCTVCANQERGYAADVKLHAAEHPAVPADLNRTLAHVALLLAAIASWGWLS